MQLKKINKKYKRDLNDLRFMKIGYINSSIEDIFNKAQERYFKLTGKYIPFTDLYRSCEASRQARIKKGKKAAKAGNSGHNFGLSFDIDLKKAFKDLQLKEGYNKNIQHIRKLFAKWGLHYIVRSDGVCEDWHFNFFRKSWRNKVIQNKAGESRVILEYLTKGDNLLFKWTVELEQMLINSLSPVLFKNNLLVTTDALKVDGVKGRKTNAAITKIMSHHKIFAYNDAHVKRMLTGLYLEYNKEI